MDRFKCFHNENRKKVCALCGQKIVFGNIKPQKFFINSNTNDLIKKHINKDFNLNDLKYPVSICRTCYLTLRDLKDGNSKRPLQSMPNYSDIVLPVNTRASKDTCNCYICITARYKGHIKIIKVEATKKICQIQLIYLMNTTETVVNCK